jgi:hypothetical protein
MIHLLIDNNGTHQQALLGSQSTATIDCSSSCNYKKQSLTYRSNGIQKNSNSVFREQNPIGDPHQNSPSVIKTFIFELTVQRRLPCVLISLITTIDAQARRCSGVR